jgi:hypothetical protein
MKRHRGVDKELYALMYYCMEVKDQFQASTALLPSKDVLRQWMGGCLVPRTLLDTLGQRKISCLELKTDSLVFLPVDKSLDLLSCRGSRKEVQSCPRIY